MAASMKTLLPVVVLAVALCTTAQTTNSLRRLEDQSSGPSRPTCYPENGFDYEGFDLENGPSTTAHNCCGECASVDGCRAWSWSPYRNGTCWLKSARGTIRVDASATSALLFDGYRASCEVAQNADFVGNDIGSAPSGSVHDCCDLCHQFLGCRAYSWSDNAGGACWFKSVKGATVVKEGVQSAQAYPSVPFNTVCGLAPDIDLEGGDFQSVASTEPTDCCAICLATHGCLALTWTDYAGGTCWLKSSVGMAKNKIGAFSSVVVPNAA